MSECIINTSIEADLLRLALLQDNNRNYQLLKKGGERNNPEHKFKKDLAGNIPPLQESLKGKRTIHGLHFPFLMVQNLSLNLLPFLH